MVKNSVALIGSRKIPSRLSNILISGGEYISNLGVLGTSGGAPGSDYLFMKKYSSENKCVIIPHQGFNNHYSGNGVHIFTDFNDEIQEKAANIIRRFYPKLDSVSKTVKHLQCRNCMQILTPTLENPVDSVIFWAPEDKYGNVSGGTRTAVYLARYLGIKTYNLYNPIVMCEFKEMIGYKEFTLDDFF
ncbi:DprA-like DNA recombination-mediator protein [Proteus phage phiP4-3]|uniref:DUF2493 domain-containing protein n=1 Tax=Proteus phage phiP4-3 TaxID=2065203 RepID=A0A2I6PFF5_9CAUD|nr:DprA-like DNA recombination-mediator protein [Proteus phage phiP4-3]AUM58458.1 hypothetical protein phiP43_100 [Proteus phage phiP4-3]AZV01298.1 hypothetical protein vBSdyM006_161 [Shigella phage vB_SdyM_006]